MASPREVHIAVLLAESVQLLDLSPIDLFFMLSPEYVTACRLPQPLLNHAIPVKITYVSETGKDSICELTANAGLRATASLNDKNVAPGNVDIVLIPGPDPNKVPSELVLEFVRAHAEVETCVIMTTCTGVIVAGATGPRGLLITGELQKKFPGVKWQDKRWVRDGKIWCSAGITNGQDMVAAYIRETWPGPTTNAVLAMADIPARSVEYGSSKAADGAWFGWQILNASVFGRRQ